MSTLTCLKVRSATDSRKKKIALIMNLWKTPFIRIKLSLNNNAKSKIGWGESAD